VKLFFRRLLPKVDLESAHEVKYNFYYSECEL
jgi:hypothetical protein